MELSTWASILQTAVPTAALLIVGVALFLDARARQVANLIRLTSEHRDLWERMYTDPRLSRILDPDADFRHEPVTAEEEMFVVFIILHLNNTYYAMKAGLYPKPEGLQKDIELFFSLPIPRAVWDRVQELQDRKFVSFVEKNLSRDQERGE